MIQELMCLPVVPEAGILPWGFSVRRFRGIVVVTILSGSIKTRILIEGGPKNIPLPRIDTFYKIPDRYRL